MTRFGDRRMMTQVSAQSLETAAARTPPFFRWWSTTARVPPIRGCRSWQSVGCSL